MLDRFGVCCVFTVSSAGTTVTQNNTYIQNPGDPTGYTALSSIQYSITKCSTGKHEKTAMLLETNFFL